MTLTTSASRTTSAPAADGRRPVDTVDAAGDAGSWALCLLLCALCVAVLAQGGYYRPVQWVVGGVLASSAALALRRRPRLPRDAAAPPVVAAGALAGWGWLRGLAEPQLWSGSRLALLALGVAATLAVVRRLDDDGRRILLSTTGVVAGLVAVAGWVGVVWHLPPLALSHDGVWRAASTLTYANATAAVLVPVALVLAGTMTGRPRDPARAALLALLLVGTAATLSRAGVVALVAGTVVLVLLQGARAVLRAAAGPVLGAAVAVVGLLPSVPLASPTGRPVATVALLAGVAAAAWLPGSTAGSRGARLAAGAVLVGVTVALAGPHLLASSTSEVAGWRAHVSSPTRADAARAALRHAAENPVVGVGPGEGWTGWRAADGSRVTMRYVHDEYLQVLVEVGALGLVLLLAVVVATGAALRTARRARPRDGLVAGAAAALAAATVHAGFDFVWHLPAVPLIVAALVGTAVGPRTHPPAPAGGEPEGVET